MLKVEFRAMGTNMAAVLETETLLAARALQEVPNWFEDWEQALSRFRPDSELNRLNANGGRETPVSAVLWKVLQAALEQARFTDGLVTPTILPALEQAGYSRSFDLLPAGPNGARSSNDDGPVPFAGEPAPWQAIQLDARRSSVQLPAGMRLDFGGSAKGWAAQEAARRLGMHGPALVDCGGDMAVSAALASGRGWPVDIADPLKMQDNLGLLEISSGGLATSGIDNRRWMQNGTWQHHIIDPRSGRPAETDLMSVTVTAPNAVQAEAAAKTVLILGSRAGLEWLEARPELKGLLVLSDGQLVFSTGMQDMFWRDYVA